MGGILVLGATGMLGQALMRVGKERGLEVIGTARTGSDIDLDVLDERAMRRCLRDLAPKTVINAVAETRLDRCEREAGMAYLLNARPASILAEVGRASEFHLVQISTDHYFTGGGAAQHDEDAPVRLVNEYARTKYAGERFALTLDDALVVRTNIVGFRAREGAPTFVEWAFESLRNGRSMTLFDDFFTSSLDVTAFSEALYDLLPLRIHGVLNLASSEVSSKKRFIETLAARTGYACSHCVAGSVHELTGEIRRAESLGLDVTRAEALLERKLPGLAEVVSALAEEFEVRKHALR